MFRQWIANLHGAFKRRARKKEIFSRVSWMVSWELFEIEKLESGLHEAQRINSIFLSPATWLAVAHPAVFELSKLINLKEWWSNIMFAGCDLRLMQKSIKKKDLRSSIRYLEERLALMQARFDWANHQESEIGPKEAVEAKFETERELRLMINDLKEYYLQEKGRPYS